MNLFNKTVFDKILCHTSKYRNHRMIVKSSWFLMYKIN